MPILSIEERVDEHFQKCGVASLDCHGMMRHILDSLGALRFRMQTETVVPQIKRVFQSAAVKFLEEIVDKDFDDISAIGLLMNTFPDEKKKGDGRGMLTLHWAAACEQTSEADFTAIYRAHPAVANHDHSKSAQDLDLNEDFMGTDSKLVVHTNGHLPIHFLVSQRRPKLANILTLLASNKATVRVADGSGWLPLHWCANNCADVDVARVLVDEYPQALSHINKRGQLPFQLAARNRNIDMLRYLYHMHPDALMTIDYQGNSALHEASIHFNPGAVAALINIKPDMALMKNFQDQLPLHCLFRIVPNDRRIRLRQIETLRVLLEHHPMTATFKDRDGCLPLHLAVMHRANAALVQLLRDVYPSAVLLPDDSQMLPVHYTDDTEIQQLLLASSTPLQKVGIRSNFAKLAV